MKPRFMVSAIHQIEMTSHCNLKCKYCAHGKMPRTKMDMDHITFLKSLEMAQRFVEAGTQQELNLAGIGESTMHPRFVEYTLLAREAIGPNCRLVLSTNGVSLTEDMVRKIAPTGIMVWVSPHRPEKAAHAIMALQKHGIYMGLSPGAMTASVNWAGQVDWPVTAPPMKCPWVTNGRVTVFSDGRIGTCCFDSLGEDGVICTIDELRSMPQYTSPYKLCLTCNQNLSIPGFQQYKEESYVKA